MTAFGFGEATRTIFSPRPEDKALGASKKKGTSLPTSKANRLRTSASKASQRRFARKSSSAIIVVAAFELPPPRPPPTGMFFSRYTWNLASCNGQKSKSKSGVVSRARNQAPAAFRMRLERSVGIVGSLQANTIGDSNSSISSNSNDSLSKSATVTIHDMSE